MSAYIKVRSLTKKYGETTIFKNLDFDLAQGEFVSIIGKSGMGKSTLLRLLSGLEEANEGGISQAGKPVCGINKGSRMMFQDGRLLPWKTILENVCLGLNRKSLDEGRSVLSQVGLEEYAERYPHSLSGGQKQRVALARALLHQPGLLLLDEPLGALDAFTRQEMQDLIQSICQKYQMTTLLVTHDIEEAVYLSDRVLVMGEGKIIQDIRIEVTYPRHKHDPVLNEISNELLGNFA